MWRLRLKVHSSWSIGLFSALFVAGVGAAQVIRLPGWLWVALIPAAIFCIAYSRVYTLLTCGCIALLLGTSYGSLHIARRDIYQSIVSGVFEVSGRIKEDPNKSASGSFSVQIDTVSMDGKRLDGVMLLSVRSLGEAKRGDVVTAKGELREGFGNFVASLTVLRFSKIERSPTSDPGRVVRDWFADNVRTAIPEPQASLGIGFLTGQKSALPEDLSEAMKIAGLTHIVVASGYNLTILVRMARKLLSRVSKYMSALSSAVMIVMFMSVTGLSPSMTRAGLVSGMSVLATYYGHVFHPFILLPLAAAITVAIQPSYVWGDLGWQLSFTAFAGVMIVSPLIQAYFFGNKEPGLFRQILGETLAAHAVTVPIIALGFGVMSNVAIIANMLVVPLVPLAMLLTFICGIWAISSLPFVEILATPTTWLLEYMTNTATFVSGLSWAQHQVGTEPLLWLGYLAAMTVVCFWMWRATKYDFRKGEPLM